MVAMMRRSQVFLISTYLVVPSAASTPKPYDCDAGSWNWEKGWSQDKKGWCCANEQVGCPSVEYDCESGYQDWESMWPERQRWWCCQHKDRGCPNGKPYDCQAGLQNHKHGWSPKKTAWCCEHEQLGCDGHMDFPTTTSATSTTTTLPWDCEAGQENRDWSWSESKKAWCCEHAQIGCTGASSRNSALTDMITTTTPTSATATTTTTVKCCTSCTVTVTVQVPVSTTERDTSCFQQNVSYEPLDMLGTVLSTEGGLLDCQDRCARVPGCTHFTYWKPLRHCHIQDNFSVARPDRADFVAGRPTCDTKTAALEDPDCFTHGFGYWPTMRNVKKIPHLATTMANSEVLDACQKLCAETKGCARFLFGMQSRVCQLVRKKAFKYQAPQFISGPPDCSKVGLPADDDGESEKEEDKASSVPSLSAMVASPDPPPTLPPPPKFNFPPLFPWLKKSKPSPSVSTTGQADDDGKSEAEGDTPSMVTAMPTTALALPTLAPLATLPLSTYPPPAMADDDGKSETEGDMADLVTGMPTMAPLPTLAPLSALPLSTSPLATADHDRESETEGDTASLVTGTPTTAPLPPTLAPLSTLPLSTSPLATADHDRESETEGDTASLVTGTPTTAPLPPTLAPLSTLPLSTSPLATAQPPKRSVPKFTLPHLLSVLKPTRLPPPPPSTTEEVEFQAKYRPEPRGVVAAFSPSGLATAGACLAVAFVVSAAAWGCRQASRSGTCRRIADLARVSREVSLLDFSRPAHDYEYAAVFLDDVPEENAVAQLSRGQSFSEGGLE